MYWGTGKAFLALCAFQRRIRKRRAMSPGIPKKLGEHIRGGRAPIPIASWAGRLGWNYCCLCRGKARLGSALHRTVTAGARNYNVKSTAAYCVHLVVQSQIMGLSRPAASQPRAGRASAEGCCRLATV